VEHKRRAPAGMTSDQCPVCGFTSGQKEKDGSVRFTFRNLNRPCSDCEEQMKADAAELQRFRERERKAGRSKAEEDKQYLLAGHPYFPHGDFKDTLSPALLEVVKLLGIEGDEKTWNSPRILAKVGDSRLAADRGWFFSPEEAEAIQNLYLEIYKYGEKAYMQGKERGADLLLSLQAGEISGKEFDKDRNGKY
jgi:hypothetical protein